MPNNNNRINFQVGYNVDQASVNAVKKSLQDLQNIKFKDFNGPKEDLDDIKQKASQVEAALNKAFNVNLNSLNTQAFNTELQKAGLSIDKIYTSFSKAGAQGQVAFSRMASLVLTTNMQLKLTNSLVSQMGETMANTVKWGIASSVMNNFTNSVRQAFDYVKALDSSLNDIRIVTKQSSELMANFAVQANNSAQALGRSTMDYTKAALTFYQQGLDEASVQARTESVLKAQNITGAGLEMADYLTAVWNGYKVANEEAELYVDKLAAVADSSASNMSLLAIAMSKVASSANLLGVPVDNLNAQIATIVATTRQAPESVGNALKTIYSRINDIATGADDAEISLGNYSSKMALVGINVLDANGRLRDTGDVIDEIGGKWETLSHEQQIYLARTMAGQRQYNNLLALFENWGKYSDLVNVSMEAQGATALKNAIYMESLSAKMEQLGAAGEKVKAALIDEDDLKGLVDFGTGAVNLFGNLILSIGGGKSALLAFGSIFTQVFSGTIAKELNNTVTHFQNVKNNALKLVLLLNSINLYGSSKGYEENSSAIRTMVDLQKDMMQYSSVLTSLQRNQYNELVKEIGLELNKLTLLKEQDSKAKDFAETIAKVNNIKLGENFKEYSNLLSDGIIKAANAAEKIQNSLREVNATTMATSTMKNLNGFNSFLNLKNLIEELNKVTANSLPSFDRYKSAIESIQNPLRPTKDEIIEVRLAARALTQEFNVRYDNYEQSLDIVDGLLTQVENKLKLLKQSAELIKNSAKQLFDITNIVNTVSAIGQLASGINNVVNLTKVWQNENLSVGEKFLQTFTNLGMTIPLVINSYKKLSSILGGATLQEAAQINIINAEIAARLANIAAINAESLAKQAAIKWEKANQALQAGSIEFEKLMLEAIEADVLARGAKVTATTAETVALEAANAAREKGTVTQLALNKAMLANPVFQVVAAIGALVAGMVALVKVYDHFTMSAKEAELAINTFNEKLKEIATNNATFALQTSTLAKIKDLYELLAEKAGAINFDSNINNLTLVERSRYNLIKNIIALYNDKAIAGYNAQGLAILANNTYIEDQIQLLKDKRQAEIDAYVSSLDFKNADKGYQKIATTAQEEYKTFKQKREDNALGFDLQGTFEDNLTILNREFGKFSDQYKNLLDDITGIHLGGIENLQKDIAILDTIQTNSLHFENKTPGIDITSISDAIDNLKGLIEQNATFEVEERRLKELAEESAKIPIDIILTKLQSSLFNTLYNALALVYGLAMLNSMIKSYINGINNGEGFKYSLNFDSSDAVLQIREQLLQSLSAVKITEDDLKEITGLISKISNIDFSNALPSQYSLYITQLIERILQENQKVKALAENDSGAFSLLIQSLFGLNNFEGYIDENGELVVQKIETKFTELRKKVHLKAKELDPIELNIPWDVISSDVQDLFTKSLHEWIANADIYQLQHFDEILKTADIDVNNVAKSLDDATEKVKNLSNVFASALTLNLLNLKTSGQSLSDLELNALKNGLSLLSNLYPEVVGSVQILNKLWLEGTSLYRRALLDVKNAVFNSFSSIGEYTDEILTKISSIITTSEDLQNAVTQNQGIFSTAGGLDWYALQLERIASGYESCTDELNRYLLARQLGNTIQELAARFDLLLATRSALNSLLYGVLAERISLVAKQFVEYAKAGLLSYQGLEENALLAADAATRYIKLNDAVVDLQDNMLKYSLVLEELNEYGIDSVLANEDMANSYENLKSTVADLLDTNLEFLSADFIKNSKDLIETITQGGLEALEALRLLQLIAAEEILINLGVDTSSLGMTTQEVADWANNLPEGLLSLDDTVFLNKLVWAMQQAGMAQTDIEAALSGLNLDIDLAPYQAGLNSAIDSAYQASDAIVSNLGFDAETKTDTKTDLDTTEIAGYLATPVPMTAPVAISRVVEQLTPFGIIPRFMGFETGSVSFSGIRVTPQPQEMNTKKQTSATALMVKNARKKSGGNISHSNRSVPGSKGKSGGGGGGGKKTSPATQAKISTAKVDTKVKTSTPNPYEQEEKSYDRQSKILDDLQDKLKKLVNKDRLKNLQEQNKTLEKQKDILQKELAISANAAAENSTANYARRLKEAFNDIAFDSDGQIADINKIQAENARVYNLAAKSAADAFEKEKENYNNYILNVWNAYATKELQLAHKGEKELWDARIKDAENAAKEAIKDADLVYKAREDLIKSYNNAWKDDQERLKEYNELTLQIYDNLIAMSKIKVDLSIDTGDFERDWLDFENKFIKKLDKNDFLGSAKASAKELMSYFNSKQVQLTADQIKKIRDLIAIMNAGAVSSIYGTNLAQAKEDLEEYMKQQMDDLEEIQDMVDDIKDNYLDAIDNAKDKMDEQIDQYERVNDLIDHNVKMVELLYGDKAYDSMNKYYNLQKTNNERELESLKKQQDYWQSRMNNEVVGSEAWEKFKKNLDDVTDSLNDKLEDMIDNLAKQFENRVNGIIARLNNALTGGRGLDFLDLQWDYISNYDDNFLDTFETKTGIEEVERLYQSEIDALAGSPKSQQKLNKLMNDQLKLLREKDHLTEYDLERAKASLEVEKARLALEEARDRKTKMRLRRDSQGNYTYQYVADEEKLGDLQAALADAQANLYNTDKLHYKQNLNTLYDTYKDYIEKMRDLTAEYNATQDEEERKRIQGRIDLLKESTAKLMSGLTEDNKYLLNYLNGSYFDGMGTDTSTLTMEEQMEIMKENIPYMQSLIQDLSDTIVGEGGILPATANMMKLINQATADYDKNVKDMLTAAGTSLATIEQAVNKEGNALDKNIINAQNLITANDELIKSCQAQIEAMEKLLDYMDKYLNKVMNVLTLLNNLRNAYNTGQGLNGSNLTADEIGMTDWGMDTTTGMEYTGNPKTDAAAIKRQIDALMAQYLKFLQGMSIATFDTGGYTGSWADASGRLAFLHQGELVLNQDDTKNILNAVQLVRGMASSINSFVNGELGSLMSGAVGLLGGISNTEQLDQNVHIEANFPNVTQHTEIEQAFENLVNMASMRASKYRD